MLVGGKAVLQFRDVITVIDKRVGQLDSVEPGPSAGGGFERKGIAQGITAVAVLPLVRAIPVKAAFQV